MHRRFQVNEPVWLAFQNGRDQNDKEIKPGEGELQFDGCDILWAFEGVTLISDTSNWLLDSWLQDGSIEEIAA